MLRNRPIKEILWNILVYFYRVGLFVITYFYTKITAYTNPTDIIGKDVRRQAKSPVLKASLEHFISTVYFPELHKIVIEGVDRFRTIKIADIVIRTLRFNSRITISISRNDTDEVILVGTDEIAEKNPIFEVYALNCPNVKTPPSWPSVLDSASAVWKDRIDDGYANPAIVLWEGT